MTAPKEDRIETIDLSVCVDCLILMANGETDPNWDEKRTAQFLADFEQQTEGLDVVPSCPEECEGSFSWSPCDSCGSKLGGDRHPAVGYLR